ncbi:MAG: hypothetical protein ACOVP9_08600, partial [Flavobacterium stagni]
LLLVFIGVIIHLYFSIREQESPKFILSFYLLGIIAIQLHRFLNQIEYTNDSGKFEGYIRFDYEGFEWNGRWYSKQEFAMVSYSINDYSGKTMGGNSSKVLLSSGTSNYFTFKTAEATHELQFRIPSENYLYPLKDVLQNYIP